MIKFRVLKTPDYDFEGDQIFYHQELTFGQNQGDILIDDGQLLNPHLELRLLNNGLFARMAKNKNEAYFLVNGKRVSGEKVIHDGDEITIGETVLKITSSMYDPEKSHSQVINRNIKELVEQDSPINKIIDVIEDSFFKPNQ
jgi:pSer/pThr/pTyr-binding forkhead associated (FHA) protein